MVALLVVLLEEPLTRLELLCSCCWRCSPSWSRCSSSCRSWSRCSTRWPSRCWSTPPRGRVRRRRPASRRRRCRSRRRGLGRPGGWPARGSGSASWGAWCSSLSHLSRVVRIRCWSPGRSCRCRSWPGARCWCFLWCRGVGWALGVVGVELSSCDVVSLRDVVESSLRVVLVLVAVLAAALDSAMPTPMAPAAPRAPTVPREMTAVRVARVRRAWRSRSFLMSSICARFLCASCDRPARAVCTAGVDSGGVQTAGQASWESRCAARRRTTRMVSWVTSTSRECASSSPTGGCCSTTCRSGSARARRWRWSAPTGPARRRCCGSSPATWCRTRARSRAAAASA